MKKIFGSALFSVLLAGAAIAGHQGEIDSQQPCTACHEQNLINQHGGFSSFVCWRCHDSDDPNVIATIENGNMGGKVYCADCHGAGGHFEKHPDYFANWMNYDGVIPELVPNWTQPFEFTSIDPAQRDYQFCMKCHSALGLGELTNGVSDYISYSGGPLTDQAMEFNPNNRSAHPVEVTASQQSGAVSPRGLIAAQMKDPWRSNVTHQTMDCVDCHGSEDGASFFLKDFDGTGNRVYWPERPDGRLWSLADLKYNRNDWQNKLFCVNCHPIYTGGGYSSSSDSDFNGFLHKAHGRDDHYDETYRFNGISYQGAVCVACHIAVPHGSKRSMLIAYYDDVDPYNYKGNTALPRGFKKASRKDGYPDYDDNNCYFPDDSISGCDHHDEWMSGMDP